MRDPLPWHPEPLKYLRHARKAFLGIDKRLGKSYLASMWTHYHQFPRVLIAAPMSAIPDWLRGLEDGDGEIAWDMTQHRNFQEWLEWGDKLPGRFFIINHHGLFLPKGRRIKCHVCGGKDIACKTCYGAGTVTRSYIMPNVLAVYDWPAVIWDETTLIRNPQSQMNNVAHTCLGSIPCRCGLSGEYVPETPLDVFEQLRWVFGTFMGHSNFWKWRNEYFEPLGYGWEPKVGVREQIRNAVKQCGFLMRKQDVGLVNETFYEPRYCDLPQKAKRIYDHAEAWMEIPGADGHDTLYTKYAVAVRTWLCRLAGGYMPERPDLQSDHKLKLLWEVIQEHPHEPLVVSFRHNAELEAAEAFLARKGETTMVLRGAQDTQVRRDNQDRFRDGRARICLKQAKVHFGADLAAADTMIRYSLPDRYEDVSQDRDRIWNPSVKRRPLLYIDLITRDTVDEDLVLASKLKGINARYFMTKVDELFTLRSQLKRNMVKK